MPNNRVLVLETDASLEGLLKAVLRREGYESVFVRDGKAALQKSQIQDFAAFVVDVTLAPSALESGARRGIGFLHYLQNHRPALLRRTVVLTGLAPRDVPADLPRVARLLGKPFDIDDFREAMTACLVPISPR